MVIAKMKEQAQKAQAKWVYADNPIYIFHAGLKTPPELAVVTLKRFWPGQINTFQIVEICRRRNVEQLLLGPISRQDSNWTNLLSAEFMRHCDEGNFRLYIKR